MEVKRVAGGLIALDGVAVTPTPQTKGAGGVGDEARAVATHVRAIQRRLDRLRLEREQPIPPDHPVIQRTLRLLARIRGDRIR
jgi:hypothetical protein